MLKQKSKQSNSLWEKIKHGFAVDDGEIITADDLAFLDKVVAKLHQRRLGDPAAFFLQCATPLNYVSSQFMVIAEPIAQPVMDAILKTVAKAEFSESDYNRVVKILSNRESIPLFIEKLENYKGENE